jgi:2-polyprenyl-3-methyl-5-hydroxy-6-metoxy-1,4-benzoquinol methylase
MEELSVHYTICPVCGSDKLKHTLYAKDYTVSEKEFDIWECGNCTLRFTQDVPDANSIGPYYQSTDYISHTDNSEGFINRVYHFIRKLTLGDKRRLILSATGLKIGKLLDIGAGTGFFVQHMQLNGWQTTGLEPDDATRERAALLNKVNLLPADVFYSLPAESFHVITMWHVLEHVHDLHPYLEQLKGVLKPGGLIFIAVPNYTSYDAAIYNSYWAAYDVPRHLYHFSPESIKQLLAMHGLQVQSIRSMRYDSFYISFLSEKYKKGNPIHGFFVALLSNMKAFINKERCSSLIYIISKS